LLRCTRDKEINEQTLCPERLAVKIVLQSNNRNECAGSICTTEVRRRNAPTWLWLRFAEPQVSTAKGLRKLSASLIARSLASSTATTSSASIICCKAI
jgi:hypothetical protein